ncbi:Fic family protein [Sansalvadorimonas verongulae]|nr:Fic family protein [Sansalvadorimonas verongulae]
MEGHGAVDAKGRYLHWSQLKWRVSRKDAVNIWYAVKFQRNAISSQIPLADQNKKPFSYCTPDTVNAMLHQIVSTAGGNIAGIAGQAASDNIQNKFLVSSLLMEEAITSAQLEGAATTRVVAKKMLKDGREPIDESERMILNNFLLLKHAERIKGEELTIDHILEFHRIATRGCTGNDVIPGELRSDNSVYVEGRNSEIAYQPPHFENIPERLIDLCRFANDDHTGRSGTKFIPPIVKAIILHFMIGYEHPFRDGNGRIARALFYWYMLKSGYDLFRYISISKTRCVTFHV